MALATDAKENKKQKNRFFFCRKLKDLSKFTLRGHELSPVKHLYLKTNVDAEEDLLEQIAKKVYTVSHS